MLKANRKEWLRSYALIQPALLGLLLAFNAVIRPREGLQPFKTNRAFTCSASAKTAIPDAFQCKLNQAQLASVLATPRKHGFLGRVETRDIHGIAWTWIGEFAYFLRGGLDGVLQFASLFKQTSLELQKHVPG
jgi:hypothetical protein